MPPTSWRVLGWEFTLAWLWGPRRLLGWLPRRCQQNQPPPHVPQHLAVSPGLWVAAPPTRNHSRALGQLSGCSRKLGLPLLLAKEVTHSRGRMPHHHCEP